MISVILNVYKRPHTLELQINAIKNQTIKVDPKNIHVWYNYSGVKQNLPSDKNIKTYQANWNTKFYGRFTIPLLCQTEYILILDDDIIPGECWIENCLNSMKKKEGLYGGSGVRLISNKYEPNIKYGWNGLKSSDIVEVDLVGHSWFFKQEWTNVLFFEKPYTFENGEDITFSYFLQKYENINTFVPPHPQTLVRYWSNNPKLDNNCGNDSNASWLINKDHYKLRNEICLDYKNKGWRLVKDKKNNKLNF